MPANRRRLHHIAPVRPHIARVEIGRPQCQAARRAIQHRPRNPARPVNRIWFVHHVAHPVADKGKRASPVARGTNDAADRLWIIRIVNPVQDHLGHRKFALQRFTPRFEIQGLAQAIPLLITRRRGQGREPGVGILDHLRVGRLRSVWLWRLWPDGQRRQVRRPHRIDRIMFGREQRGELAFEQDARVVGLAHRDIGEGRSVQDNDCHSGNRPAKVQAHYLVFPVISPMSPGSVRATGRGPTGRGAPESIYVAILARFLGSFARKSAEILKVAL